MPYQNLSQRRRIAEESQLLAEERWIKEALAKIRKQRNCLQIEKLHLESMKGQLKMESERSQKESNAQKSYTPVSEQLDNAIRESLEFEEAIIDEGCNEELNLDVNKPAYGHLEKDPLDMEEEDDDEDVGGEDLLIDMDMLMNGKPVKWD